MSGSGGSASHSWASEDGRQAGSGLFGREREDEPERDEDGPCSPDSVDIEIHGYFWWTGVLV